MRRDPGNKPSPAPSTKLIPVMRGVLTSPYLSLASRLVLGGVLLYAGATKVFDPGGLAASVRSYELPLPEWFVTLLAHALPLLEVLLGLYLVVGLFTRASALAASGLILVFSLVLLQGAARGLAIDCGCFGSASSSSGVTGSSSSGLWVDILRDLGLLVLGLRLAYAPLGRFSADAALRRR